MALQNKRRKIVEEPTMVGFLCATDGRRQLLEYLFCEIKQGNTEERMTGTIMDDTGLSRNAVVDHIDIFLQIGLVEASDGNKFTWYEPNEGDAFAILAKLDDQLKSTQAGADSDECVCEIVNLYDGDSRRILVDFFIYLGMDYLEELDEGSEPDPLSKQDIYDNCGVTRKTIIKEIDTLVAYDLVGKDEEFSYERYYPEIESTTFSHLVTANDRLIALFESHME